MSKGRQNSLEVVFLAFTKEGKTIAIRVGQVLDANSDSTVGSDSTFEELGQRYLSRMKEMGLIKQGRRNCFGRREYVLTEKGKLERERYTGV